ncbi:MAG: penicillin-binding protein [Lachnospiraceae bacterium]|jgi:penicillin-binding protein 2|nr:penicillin-binding protein [Lachnospiraceae bacterium]
MFDELKENLLNSATIRLLLLFLIFATACAIMIWRVFDLQIVRGEEYLDTFQLRIKKERSIPATRGNVFDRNGSLLAYNDLSFSVQIEDVFESGRNKNIELNETIYRLIKIIERCGDITVSDFRIILDADENYAFTTDDREDRQLRRFLADVYGKRTFAELDYRQQTATATMVVEHLAQPSRFGIGEFADVENRENFIVGAGYTKEEVLQIMTIRYDMMSNSFQRFIPTTVATNVNELTVAVVMENLDTLRGVQIAEDTFRRYVDALYFAHILGYTGRISQDELEHFRADPAGRQYDMNDTIGKLGIERSMEHILQGTKGHETVFVDNVGRVISTSNHVDAAAGNDIYLTIDKDLQIAVYHILEEKIASIIYTKLRNIREYVPTANATSTDIVIPIYDVYYALINNSVISIDRLGQPGAGEHQAAVSTLFNSRKNEVILELVNELYDRKTPFDRLSEEGQTYQRMALEILFQRGILNRDTINVRDTTYQAFFTDESISLSEFIEYAIAVNWIDITRLDLHSQYADADEMFDVIVAIMVSALRSSSAFDKRVLCYLIMRDVVSGRQLCHILLEQGVVVLEEEILERWYEGRTTPFQFLSDRIAHLDITPAQLALDPFSGSAVITDVKTGEVLAMVSYPGYDNNRMANGVDAAYYSMLLNDLSRPMFNYATQQRTAPGSTLKMVSATAGILEGIIGAQSSFTCNGIFEEVYPPPRCWIYPGGRHGTLNLAAAVTHSCNVYFYEIGYRAGMFDGAHSSDEGIRVLSRYIDMFGLNAVTGIEVDEAMPHPSTIDAVRSMIGQGNANFTTVGLARYVTAVANNGICYDLTLIDKITDPIGNLLVKNEAVIRNTIPLADSEWNSIHQGMRQVVERRSYFDDLAVLVAGKTGTAQETALRPSHALFVGYAPYREPEIGLATRVAFGYSSDYAAQITREIIKYYYGLAEHDEIITGVATELEGGTMSID